MTLTMSRRDLDTMTDDEIDDLFRKAGSALVTRCRYGRIDAAINDMKVQLTVQERAQERTQLRRSVVRAGPLTAIIQDGAATTTPIDDPDSPRNVLSFPAMPPKRSVS